MAYPAAGCCGQRAAAFLCAALQLCAGSALPGDLADPRRRLVSCSLNTSPRSEGLQQCPCEGAAGLPGTSNYALVCVVHLG